MDLINANISLRILLVTCCHSVGKKHHIIVTYYVAGSKVLRQIRVPPKMEPLFGLHVSLEQAAPFGSGCGATRFLYIPRCQGATRSQGLCNMLKLKVYWLDLNQPTSKLQNWKSGCSKHT